MTRINIIPPEDLYDQHLIAEYREITMVPAALRRTLESKNGLDISKIPERFTLNRGHVYFFYNKGKYLDKRYNQIIKAMKNRGFKPNLKRLFPKQIFIDNDLYYDWKPSEEDVKLIKQRISKKIKQKPDWYKKSKQINISNKN